MISFSQILNPDLEQRKLTAAENSRKNGSKSTSSVVRNRLKIWQDILETPFVFENVKK